LGVVVEVVVDVEEVVGPSSAQETPVRRVGVEAEVEVAAVAGAVEEVAVAVGMEAVEVAAEDLVTLTRGVAGVVSLIIALGNLEAHGHLILAAPIILMMRALCSCSMD
jgi:hypothetical protein